MQSPTLELIPGKHYACSDAEVSLDVLVRITPPLPEVHFPRPPLNVALVLDRSGSMAEGKKMHHARDAAAFVVEQLLPTDRVSVTIFDDQVETLAPNALATEKAKVVRQIRLVQPRGSTDLHGGWVEGARQVEAHALESGINRVLLLSDGLANVGVVDPNTIAAEARGLASRRVSTTTLGVGDDYNEDLMESMATAGDGHYYFIESPQQLVDIFQSELQGLMATLGQRVTLTLGTSDGVKVADVLNDLERGPDGALLLPNLVVGMPILVVIRLRLPANPRQPVLSVQLAWDDPRSGHRHAVTARLDALANIPSGQWAKVPVDPAVAEQEALLMVARAQKEASEAMRRGDVAETRQNISRARGYLGAVASSPVTREELAALGDMEAQLEQGDRQHLMKFGKFRAYSRRTGRTAPPKADPPSTEPDPKAP